VDRVNILIIGGGVVGCATAAELAARWDNVFLVEQLPRLGMAASTRNSGVLHSGLYYPPGSLKARHCVAGNRISYEFCAAHNVPHRRTSKLIVAASPGEELRLSLLAENGRANGVENLRLIDRAAIRAREPHIAGHSALEVPAAGIVSSEELVKAYARIAQDRGASLLTHARVTRLEPQPDSIRVTIQVGDSENASNVVVETVEASCVVNSAGLYADEVAALLGNHRFRIYPVRGEYCELVRSKSHLVQSLVYPLPHPEGLSLGVHLTKTLWGTVLVGPTARYVTERNDYERDRLPIEEFARRAKPLLPEIVPADLSLAYSGLRPKLTPPGAPGPADFVIERDPQFPRVIHLIGIESPGLTAAPSIALHVSSLVSELL